MKNTIRLIIPGLLMLGFTGIPHSCRQADHGPMITAPDISMESLREGFLNPPDDARPWVYWINMDGHFNMEGITADLEAIRDAGLGGVLFMEVDLGVPRGEIHYMSPAYRQRTSKQWPVYIHNSEMLFKRIAIVTFRTVRSGHNNIKKS